MISKKLLIGLALALSGCQHSVKGASDIRITNGAAVTPDQFREVVQIRTAYSPTVSGYCSGTFVSPRTLITAAHCAPGDLDTGVASGDNIYFGDVAATKFITHPYKYSEDRLYVALDLAVVIFPTDVSSDYCCDITTTPAILEQTVVMVGFGKLDIDDPNSTIPNGAKRYGINKLQRVGDGVLTLAGVAGPTSEYEPGVGSATANGDSGGPLYDLQDQLIGVTSSGSVVQGQFGQLKKSELVDLTSPMSKRVLCLALNHGAVIPGLDAQSCGAFAKEPGECSYTFTKIPGGPVTERRVGLSCE